MQCRISIKRRVGKSRSGISGRELWFASGRSGTYFCIAFLTEYVSKSLHSTLLQNYGSDKMEQNWVICVDVDGPG